MKVLALALLAVTALSTPARAGDALIEGGRLCTEQFPVQEKQNNIPTHLLAAISTTESGRWHEGLGMAVPWPWTINVEGKGYYFPTKAAAIAQTQYLLSQGHQSIDVGCMQVNLKHHNHAFRNLEEAFDPKTNVAYAAKFLHDNYAELGDWIKATAAYHSRTQVLGQQYLAEIERSWNKIVQKVAAARASQSQVATVTQGAKQSAEVTADAKDSITHGTAAIAQAQHEMSVKPTSHPISATHNVQVVSVNNEPVQRIERKKENDVLVIRGNPGATAPANFSPAPQVPTPPIAAAAATPTVPMTATITSITAAPQQQTPAVRVADNNVDSPLVVRPQSDSVRRVALDNAPADTQPKASSASPKFVFAN